MEVLPRYDTGVVSGAMAVILEEKGGLLAGLERESRDFWHQLIVASTIGSAAVFSLLSGLPSERLGRKPGTAPLSTACHCPLLQ